MTYQERLKKPAGEEELSEELVRGYLEGVGEEVAGALEIMQFAAGHSNLTYLLGDEAGSQWVLRRPPIGANIKSGHDMAREFQVLEAIRPVFNLVPEVVALNESAELIGAPFFIMRRVDGVILRGGVELDEPTMGRACDCLVKTFVSLHAADVGSLQGKFGNPDGYVKRQVDGWIGRYHKSQTDDVPGMYRAEDWLRERIPETSDTTLIHNDFKYDNLVYDQELNHVVAVLDWEMATLGDPLMDLGTTLGYWVEAGDPEFLQAISGPTALPGNLSRRGFAEAYAAESGRSIKDLDFYYVYGLYKIAVIGQQIYARYAKGLTQDPRFGALIFAIHALAERATQVIETGEI